jgi:predicted nucleic acid-binding protein
MAVRGEYDFVCSKLVVEEARRNLAKTSEDYVLFLDFVLDNIPIEYVRPTKRHVLATASHVALKDAPIVAAAKRAEVDLLVSLDKKHLLGKPELAEYAGVNRASTPNFSSRIVFINLWKL